MPRVIVALTAVAYLVAAGACGPASRLVSTPTPLPAEATTASTAQTSTPSFSSIPFDRSTLVAQLNSDTNSMFLAPVDPATGLPLEGYKRVDLGISLSYAFSDGGDTLIFTKYTSPDAATGELHFLNLRSWQDEFAMLLLGADLTSALAVSPDGQLLAVATGDTHGGDLWLVDGREHASVAHSRVAGLISSLRFSTDGQTIMSYEHPDGGTSDPSQGPPVIAVRSAADLSLQWSKTLPQIEDGFVPNQSGSGDPNQPDTGSIFQPAVVFAPASDTLYVVHADVPKLTRVDFDRKLVLTLNIRPEVSWIEGLLALSASDAYAKGQNGVRMQARISPDGTLIYTDGVQTVLTKTAEGSTLETQSPLALQAIRLKDATQIYAAGIKGASLDLSPDGSRLLIPQVDYKTGTVEGTMEVDPTNGSLVGQQAGLALNYDSRLDGTSILVSSVPTSADARSTQMTALTPAFEILGAWFAPQYSVWLTANP